MDAATNSKSASSSLPQLAWKCARRACAVFWASPVAAPARWIIAKHKLHALSIRRRSQALAEAVEIGDVIECRRLLSEHRSTALERRMFLGVAAANGHADILRILISAATRRDDASEALCYAAGNGHAECVRLLIPVSDPKADDSNALRWAAEDGHAECVKLLLPVSGILDQGPACNQPRAIISAARNGHADCVKILAPASDKDSNAEALFLASRHGHAECVQLLIPFSPPLIERADLFIAALSGGHASVVELILQREPRFLAGIDLSKCLATAKWARRDDLAAFLGSVIERQALSSMVGVSPDHAPSQARRL